MLKVNSKSFKISVTPSGGIKHTRFVPKDKCAMPDELVCIVWESTTGVNGRGSYRVERTLFPFQRIEAKNISRQHGDGESGRVTI